MAETRNHAVAYLRGIMLPLCVRVYLVFFEDGAKI